MQYRIDKKDGSGSVTMTVLPKAVRTKNGVFPINHVRAARGGQAIGGPTGPEFTLPCSVESLRPDSIAGCVIEFPNPRAEMAKWLTRSEYLRRVALFDNPIERARAEAGAKGRVFSDDLVTITPLPAG